jgi:hypothetical protein
VEHVEVLAAGVNPSSLHRSRSGSLDQLRLRAELAAVQEQIVTLLRSAVGESLGLEQAQAVAEEARAWRGANAFRLVRYLSDRPDALSRPSSDCPTCVVRLPAALTVVGHGDKVALVPCRDCGRTEPLPTNNGPEGRLCSPCAGTSRRSRSSGREGRCATPARCAGRRAKKPCARCGKVAGILPSSRRVTLLNSRGQEGISVADVTEPGTELLALRRIPQVSSQFRKLMAARTLPQSPLCATSATSSAVV